MRSAHNLPVLTNFWRDEARATWHAICSIFAIFLVVLVIPTRGMAAKHSDIGRQVRPGAQSVRGKRITIQELEENGRPANYYKVMFDSRPDVCGPILKALNEPSSASQSDEAAVIISKEGDILLRNRYSIKWAYLGELNGMFPYFRAKVDINYDEVEDVIYIETDIVSSEYTQHLVWMNDYPTDEQKITYKRSNEFVKKLVDDPELGLVKPELEVTRRTIDSPIPLGMDFPEEKFFDVVKLGNRSYLLVAPAFYMNHPDLFPLRVAVLEVHNRRKQTLLCYFRSAFILQTFH